MSKKEKYFAAAGITLLLLFISKVGRASYQVITDWLIPEFESFSAAPYWDVSRYSWGYGTPAPGPTGTITRAQALIEMRKHVERDYLYLKPFIKVPLSGEQWAALLSFSYNLGEGSADNLAANINSGDMTALKSQWLSYNKMRVNGILVYSQTLADRRAQEWEIFNGRV